MAYFSTILNDFHYLFKGMIHIFSIFRNYKEQFKVMKNINLQLYPVNHNNNTKDQ